MQLTDIILLYLCIAVTHGIIVLSDYIECNLSLRKQEREEKRFVMPFGKYQGIPVAHVPLSYLEWCVENYSAIDQYPFIIDYYHKNKDRLCN